MQKLPPKELEPRVHDRTGWRALTRHAMDTLILRRGVAHGSTRPGKEERRQLMLPAIPVSSHARTVPGPASLGSDSTATSVPIADGSNAEGCHHRFRWTTTNDSAWGRSLATLTRGGRRATTSLMWPVYSRDRLGGLVGKVSSSRAAVCLFVA